MSVDPDIDRFVTDVLNKIEYYRREYNFSYSEVVGALEIIQHGLMHELDAESKE